MKTQIELGKVRWASSTLSMGGQTFAPDPAKAYFEFFCAHGFPVVTMEGTALHPAVVAASHQTMLHQIINLGHLMAHYGTSAEDRTLGSVVAVEFPEMPEGGWRVARNTESSPGLRGIGVLHRACQGVRAILEQQHSGERNWTVSLEVSYSRNSSAMAIRREKVAKYGLAEQGPEDFMDSGWSVYEWDQCTPMAQNALVSGTSQVAYEHFGDVVFLLGGLRGPVQFEGLALTLAGKEPTARAGRFTASGALPTTPDAALPHLALALALLKDAGK